MSGKQPRRDMVQQEKVWPGPQNYLNGERQQNHKKAKDDEYPKDDYPKRWQKTTKQDERLQKTMKDDTFCHLLLFCRLLNGPVWFSE